MQIPAAFDYARATSVDHVLELLEQHGPESRIVAGGHSLLPMMKLRLARPDCLIDINSLTELDSIVEEDGWLRVGALTRHAGLLESELVSRLFPMIGDAERVIADPIVRNRGTIGGSLCQADPAEDLSTVCDVLAAEVVIASPSGLRTVPMTDFHRGPYESAVQQHEMLLEVRFPIHAHSGSAYEKVERRVGDWAVAAVGASITLAEDGTISDAAVGFTALGGEGLATEVADALRGRPAIEATFVAAGAIAAATCDPTDDQRGPVDYKRHLADELTRRVLRLSTTRAQRVLTGV